MLDFDAHTRFADATAELMRSCAVAAAQTMTVSACRGLTLWSDLLRPSAERRVSRLSRPAAANPFEVFWRFSPMHWMPKSGIWPQSNWLPSYTSGLGWSPYAAWGSSPYAAWPMFSDWSTWSRLYWPSWSGQSAYASALHPAGSGDAGGAARHLAVGLRQLSIGRRARRGADHHARQGCGRRQPDDDCSAHADADHARHVARRARRVTRAKPEPHVPPLLLGWLRSPSS